MDAFKAYDIRGVYDRDFNAEDVYKIGFFLPELLEADRVVVGYDARLSSEEIFSALTGGITDRGVDVYNIGPATTPMVYFATANYNFPASVQITASHNPREYNGLKVSRGGAVPVGYDTGLARLEEMVENSPVNTPDSKGRVYYREVKEDYIEFQRSYLPDIEDLKIAVDCSNGMAALIIKDILGTSPVYIYDDIDCTFPNHEPNPLVEENVEDLKEVVRDRGCDLGIIFDGDGDRVMFVDEKGNFISPDLITGVMADYFLEDEGARVLHDIRTSRAVSEYIRSLGGKPYLWKVGHAYAKRKLREIDGVYGGELAGHYYFSDFFYCDSGILAALIVLAVAARNKNKGRKFSRLIERLDKYSFSGEINFRINDKYQAMERVKDYFVSREEPLKCYDFDGYRVEYTDWWFNIRPSNTEPYLRLVVEADNDRLLAEKTTLIREVLGQTEK